MLFTVKTRDEIIAVADELNKGVVDKYAIVSSETGKHYLIDFEKYDRGEYPYWVVVQSAEEIDNPRYKAPEVVIAETAEVEEKEEVAESAEEQYSKYEDAYQKSLTNVDVVGTIDSFVKDIFTEITTSEEHAEKDEKSDYEKRIAELNDQVDALTFQNQDLRAENAIWSNNYKMLEEENKALKEKVAEQVEHATDISVIEDALETLPFGVVMSFFARYFKKD